MDDSQNITDHLIDSLKERAKELNCLYRVDEILSRPHAPAVEVFKELVDALPPGWKYPESCRGMIRAEDEISIPETPVESPWRLAADIIVQGEKAGEVAVYYTEEKPRADEGPFLREERRLINAIAERIGLFLMQRRLRKERESWQSTMVQLSARQTEPWEVLVMFLRRTDPNLLKRITRKMINHLCWNGVKDAEDLLQESLHEAVIPESDEVDENRPLARRSLQETAGLTDKTFKVAAEHMSEGEIVAYIQSWINEEKSTFLIKSLENPGSGLSEMAEAIERFQVSEIEESELPVAVQTTLKVALLRRFFVDQLDFINVAKNYVGVKDFYDLVQHLIFPPRSQGKLGGKGAGLFLATQILKHTADAEGDFSDFRCPKTWYVASDAILEFIQYNNLNEVYNRKYMEVERVRHDYPHIIQVFKNSTFPPEIVKGLSSALDDFDDRPLIVRSSSLLEDRVGSAFSGKYKSLFLANQGPKKQRLEALLDAIAEVYASVFGPDPIEYRAERGLLDFREEMGIMIQEVVGKRVGPYFFPAYSGVLFSHNEFRWSPRIKREDGLVRMVPGLGTRAVDRMSDDYPVLAAPGQPGLRVNVTADEVVRYSPKKMDVLNLEKNEFETVDVHDLLRQYGEEFPGARQIVSIVDGDRVRKPVGLEPDWEHDDYVVTFEGLLSQTPFLSKMRHLLGLLRDILGLPVDLEFASDGEFFYLVQSRTQSFSEDFAAAAIPRNIPREKILFTANRTISNGRIPEITHVVYVNPAEYGDLSTLREMRDVARAVGRLNLLLPKRQFILMGPGRWGSRGDIKLGVSVTYSDINNTAALLEIARKRGAYLPELSFGTHFFQDLVEADIRYIPLYPDMPDIVFNEAFLLRSKNILPDILPEFAHLADVVRVIDVPSQTEGRILRILLNADLEEAVGMFDTRGTAVGSIDQTSTLIAASPEDHWRWRLQMAERLGAHLDPAEFGVKGLYVFGSTKNASAGPNSDLDLIVHIDGTPDQRRALEKWLQGWSQSLAEVNYLRTGYRSEGLLDVHLVTDDDIRNKTSFASKIGAVTDAARPLPLKE